MYLSALRTTHAVSIVTGCLLGACAPAEPGAVDEPAPELVPAAEHPHAHALPPATRALPVEEEERASRFGDDAELETKHALLQQMRKARLRQTPWGDPEAIFDGQLNPDGTLGSLGGEGLAPECRAGKVVDEAQAEKLFACFVRSYDPLFGRQGSSVEPSSWQVTELWEGGRGIVSITVDQRIDGIRIEGGRATLTLHHGEAVSYTGHLYPAALLPRSLEGAGMPSEAAETLTRKLLGEPLGKFRTRYFDVDHKRVVSEWYVGSAGLRIASLDETAGELIGTRPASVHHNLQDFLTQAGRYNDAVLLDDNTGELSVLTWDHIVNGTDCQTRYDAGAGNNNPNPMVINDPDDSGDGPVYVTDAPCITGFPHDFFFDMRSRDGALVNLFYWFQDLAEFTTDPDTGYFGWWPTVHNSELKVVLSATNGPCQLPGADACFAATCTEELFGGWDCENYRVIMPLAAAERLQFFVHEHGHYVHQKYRVMSTNALGLPVSEGFADHNVLRYAIHRHANDAQRADDRLELARGYESPIPGLTGALSPNYRHRNGPSNGLYRPESWVPEVSELINSALTYDDVSQACSSNNPYLCGSVISAVYWELAWNEIRAPYRNFAVGTPVLTTSNYASEPEQLANTAFTYAIKNADESLGFFFSRVSSAYHTFWQDGWISEDEYWRVHAVLNHHCVGWSNHCFSGGNFHKVAWSRLPETWTAKSTFATDNEQYVRSEDFVLEGTPNTYSHQTSEGASYVRLDSDDDTAVIHFTTLQHGRYSLHAAVRSYDTGTDSVWVRVDGGDRIYWDIEDNFGSWIWSHTGPTVELTPGAHTIRLERRETLRIDSLLIRNETALDSCEFSCGGVAPSGCFCDPACTTYADCCPDSCTECGNCMPGTCGNDACDFDDECNTVCGAECGSHCIGSCGNGRCDFHQDCVGGCPEECGTANCESPSCGNGSCESGDCLTCPEECGEGYCSHANGFCNPLEDCEIAPWECGRNCPWTTCGDNVCNALLDCTDCPWECQTWECP